MDTTPQLDEDLVAKSLAEFADVDYQTQVWAGRVPSVRSSLVECYAALYGESGLADALDAGPVFSSAVDDGLLRLRELLESVDESRPITYVLRDPALIESRTLAAGILRELGVTRVIKRGRPELDAPLELPAVPVAVRVAIVAILATAVAVGVLIALRPAPYCEPEQTSDTVVVTHCSR